MKVSSLAVSGFLLALSPAGSAAAASTQPGAPTSCATWYTAEVGDTCAGIASANNVPLATFIAENPQLNGDCVHNLWAGYAYCLSVGGGSSSSPATANPVSQTTFATAVATGVPQVPGDTGVKVGEITYYAVGMGSCEHDNSDSDPVVALPIAMMEQSNKAYCGRVIGIEYGGKSAQATVADTCMGCASAHIDVAPTIFTDLGIATTAGTATVAWSFL